MILVWLVLMPMVAGALCVALGARLARWVALAALMTDLAFACTLLPTVTAGSMPIELQAGWIPQLGVRIHLAVDGLSMLLVLLTLFLGIMAVLASWREVRERVALFHLALLWVLGGLLGVFLALDLILFYAFWELMLVPMAFLIWIWGHEKRTRAAIKFFLFTQASGLLMLLSILGLAFAHRAQTGVLSFDYADLLRAPVHGAAANWLMLGFFVAFAVKLPAVPLHTWLPDAHTEAPTAGSVVLAGLLLKTGGYGILRFALPLFPEASRAFAPVAMTLGVVGIIYGAVQAFGQTDLKRLVAYTSVSHLGFVLVGAYSLSPTGTEGAILEMLCHGLSTGGLFIVAGALQERLGTRELDRMGGLYAAMPRMGVMGTALAMASLGLPGLGNFVAEFLALLGAFRTNVAVAAVASAGFVLSTVYSLAIVQRVFFGQCSLRHAPVDLSVREAGALGIMVAGLLWLGVHPQPVLETAAPAVRAILQAVGGP